MGRRVSIPVRVVRPDGDPYRRASLAREMEALRRAQTGLGPRPPVDVPPEEESVGPAAAPVPADQVETIEAAPRHDGGLQAKSSEAGTQAETEEWRSQALRLQAEMDNYRKRQQRLAQDQIQAERERLLNAFLGIVDDLERALAVLPGGGGPERRDDGVRRGVELTHRAALHLLE